MTPIKGAWKILGLQKIHKIKPISVFWSLLGGLKSEYYIETNTDCNRPTNSPLKRQVAVSKTVYILLRV